MKYSLSSGGDQQWDSVDRTVKEEGYGEWVGAALRQGRWAE